MNFTEFLSHVQNVVEKHIDNEYVKIAKEKFKLEVYNGDDFDLQMDYYNKIEKIKRTVQLNNQMDIVSSTMNAELDKYENEFIKYDNSFGLLSITLTNDIVMQIPQFCSKKVQDLSLQIQDLKKDANIINKVGIEMLKSKSIRDEVLLNLIKINDREISPHIKSIILSNDIEAFNNLILDDNMLIVSNFNNIISGIAFYYGFITLIRKKKIS